jgi:hypothetical protein
MTMLSRTSRRLSTILSYAAAAIVPYAASELYFIVAGIYECSAPGSIWPGAEQLAEIALLFLAPYAIASAIAGLLLHVLLTTLAPHPLRPRLTYAVPILTIAILAIATTVTLTHPPTGCRIDF